jgi:quercetin dioxygenase-like cupin family protein
VSGGDVRRVVTGHDEQGLARIVEDAIVEGSPLLEAPDNPPRFAHLWATREFPVALDDEAAVTQGEGSAATIIGTGAGTVLRVGYLPPGMRSPLHRTQSLDYGIVLDGECDLETDGGDVTTLRAGDVVIQRGTNHVWHNRTDKPCRMAWILLDAQPVMVDGRPLGDSWQS